MAKYALIIENKVVRIIDADSIYIDNVGGDWIELSKEDIPKVTIGLIFNNKTNTFE